MKHLPNALTGLRLVLSLFMFVAMALIGDGLAGGIGFWMARLAFVAYVVAAVTDFFDGWLARRWGVTSLAGAILDPIADKILVCGAILGLLALRGTGFFVVLVGGGVILFREFAVSALREVLAPRGIKLPVTFLAKTKTTLQLVSLGALLFLSVWPVWGLTADIPTLIKAVQAAEILFLTAAVITVWTGLDYGRAAMRALKAVPASPAAGG